MSISLTKSLRTTKVASDPGNVAQGFRLFDDNMQCQLGTTMVDTYGRPSALYAGNQFLGNGAPGCFTPQYRIMTENIVSRPQYSAYLNLPQGLSMMNSEVQGRKTVDLLGVGRDRSFGMDGTFQYAPYPSDSNPSSDDAFMNNQSWFNGKLQKVNENRTFLSSADTQSGF